MKSKNLTCGGLLLLCTYLNADSTYDLTSSGSEIDAFMVSSWEDFSIWDNGVPTPSCDVFMPTQVADFFDPEFGEYVEGEPVFTSVALDQPVTIASLEMEFDSEVIAAHNFTVTGTTDNTNGGFLTVNEATMRLGDYLNYNLATKTLAVSSGYTLREFGTGGQAILEFLNADIQICEGGFNMFGANLFVGDQNTGLDAFRNLREIRSFFNIADGYHLNVGGNLTVGSNGSVTIQEFGRTTRFTVGGSLVNDGEIELNGDSVFNVAGSYSGSGTITTSGTGNQISVIGAHIQEGPMEIADDDDLTFGDDLTLNDDLTMNGDDTVVTVEGDLINNDSLIIIKGDGTRIEVTGDILQTGGKVDTGPSGVDSFTMKARTGVYENNACISGNGTLQMPVNVNNSFVTPGSSPGELTIEGDLTITGSSNLEIELGGTVQGVSYDHVAQSDGTTLLGGTLTIKAIDGFDCELMGSDSFTVLTSDAAITGAFTNVASGSRLATDDGLGTFLVSYGNGSSAPNRVILSDFEAAAVVPKTFAEWSLEQGFAAPNPSADQNGNGVNDLLDYAFGGSTPTFSEIETSDGEFVWTFGLPRSVTGVLLSSVKATSLDGTFVTGPIPVASGSSASKNLFTLTDEDAVTSSPHQFYQLVVTLEEES